MFFAYLVHAVGLCFTKKITKYSTDHGYGLLRLLSLRIAELEKVGRGDQDVNERLLVYGSGWSDVMPFCLTELTVLVQFLSKNEGQTTTLRDQPIFLFRTSSWTVK